METPIHDFVSRYVNNDPVRLHMPGHKGSALINGARFDITEVKGTDDLIARSEKNASEIFGCPTYYSAEGSSLCIRAMLSIMSRQTGKKTVVAARNCHQTFISACALLDLDVVWIPNDGALVSAQFDISAIENILAETDPCCVYITSPDYLGFVADIEAIADVCHSHGTYLAVDNAHGAYLKFFGSHPMELGADICCDSAHKTLPVLTGGAYLHVSEALNIDVRRELALFASTSPSWLILDSLDCANEIMASGFAEALRETAAKVGDLSGKVSFKTYGNEYLKLTLCPNDFGYTGDEIADILRVSGIEPEFSDINYVTFMFSSYNRDEDFERLEKALATIAPRTPLQECEFAVSAPNRIISIREAVFARTRTVPVSEATGKIAGFVKTSCPPAVPIVIAGERITAEHVDALKAYGFETIEVCCDFE